MRALGMALSLVLLTGLGSSCGDSPTEPETIFGLYQLVTVGGLPMPFVLLEDETGSLEIVAGSLILYEDFKFKTDWTIRLTVGDQSDTYHDINGGTFEQSGSTLTFSFPDGSTFPGTVNDGRVTVDAEGTIFVYAK
jgi:hypothetical protein